MKNKNIVCKKAQIGIEFILLTIFSLAMLLVLLASVSSLSSQKMKQKAYFEVNDIAASAQQEILLASELHDGYRREFFIPESVQNLDFSMVLDNASSGNYLRVSFENQETFYLIPPITGNIKKGINTLTKKDGMLFINE